jgi:hypothetical protein
MDYVDRRNVPIEISFAEIDVYVEADPFQLLQLLVDRRFPQKYMGNVMFGQQRRGIARRIRFAVANLGSLIRWLQDANPHLTGPTSKVQSWRCRVAVRIRTVGPPSPHPLDPPWAER